MAIELTDDLIELERAAWAEQQANALTVETAAAVQAAITAHAEATGQSRFEVERELKRVVRHPAENDEDGPSEL
ncbi:hypothetical protein [Streptomyces sp. NPDC059278]|uniref:hypothetical protein n=1 Tax=Streptomyces sp. NPDC059278 TaxID=3346801 RepID=UPI00368513C8